MRGWIAIGALSSGIAAALGAAIAHTMMGDPAAAVLLSTAQQYQLWHGLGLILVGLAGSLWPGRLAQLAAWCFLAGTLLFSGGLYLRGFTGESIGLLVPVGGTLFMLGWLAFAGHGLGLLPRAAGGRISRP